jgi:hypothetical protein
VLCAQHDWGDAGRRVRSVINLCHMSTSFFSSLAPKCTQKIKILTAFFFCLSKHSSLSRVRRRLKSPLLDICLGRRRPLDIGIFQNRRESSWSVLPTARRAALHAAGAWVALNPGKRYVDSNPFCTGLELVSRLQRSDLGCPLTLQYVAMMSRVGNNRADDLPYTDTPALACMAWRVGYGVAGTGRA